MRVTIVIIDRRVDVVMFVSHGHGTGVVTAEANSSVFTMTINSVVFPHPLPPRVMLTVMVMVIVTKVR